MCGGNFEDLLAGKYPSPSNYSPVSSDSTVDEIQSGRRRGFFHAPVLWLQRFSLPCKTLSIHIGIHAGGICSLGLGLSVLSGRLDSCDEHSDGPFYVALLVLLLIILMVVKRQHLLSIKISSWYILLRGRSKQDPAAPIWRLPPELIQSIVKGSPPISASAFALTSRTVLAVVGRQYLKLNRDDRLALLEHLQADLPYHLLCHHCAVFHTKSSLSQNDSLGCLRRNGYLVATL